MMHAFSHVMCLGSLVLGLTAQYSDRALPPLDPGGLPAVAADFRLADLHGVQRSLSEIEAPVIVLHFWSKYRDCDSDLQLLQRLHEKYGTDNVSIVGLPFSSGTRGQLTSYLEDIGVDFPNLMCTNAVRLSYDVATFPTTFLLDDEKRLRYWMYGILVEDHWDQLVRELLAEEQDEIATEPQQL